MSGPVTRTISLHGWISVPPDELPRLRPLLDEHVRLTRAEPGCLAFSVMPSPATRAASTSPSASATAPPSTPTRPAPPPPPGAPPPGTSSATTASRRRHDHPLRLGRLRPADAGLPRRGMGRARARRPRALGEARARRLPGRPRLDHRPAQARRLPRRLRRLRPRRGRPLRRGRRRPPARRPRHHPLARQDRRRHRRRAASTATWPTAARTSPPTAGPSPTGR